MKGIQPLKDRIVRLLTTPGEELGRWARFLRFQIQLWRFCARRLRENNALAMSSALSFRTIFALVPAMVLALLVLNSFQAFGEREEHLRRFLDLTGLSQITVARTPAEPQTAPAAAETSPTASAPAAEQVNLADWIEQTVASVEQKLTLGRIGPIGALVLIWTALTLLTTMERSLNRIFGARRSRSLARSLLLYWSVVTLGPIFIAAALYVGDAVAEAVGETAVVSRLLAVVGWAGPVVAGIVLLALLYKLMPNTVVSFRAAMGGAVLAAPLWLLAKWGFALYVEIVAARSIYGALGLLPLFLFWLNTSWLIFLFGAELAHTAVNLSVMQSAEQARKTALGPSDMLAAAVAVGRSFVGGSGAAAFRDIVSQLNLPDESVAALLDRLIAGGILSPAGVENEAFVLVRPPESVPVATIMEIAAPLEGSSARPRYRGDLADIVTRAAAHATRAMKGWTLADVIAEGEPGES